MKTLIGIASVVACVGVPAMLVLFVHTWRKNFGVLNTSGSSKQMFASLLKRHRQIKRESTGPHRVSDDQIQRARKRMVESFKD
jgi:hypothetical protein